ncbi:phosphoglucosamine mutase [Candidatus Saccharibacteria bacterium]|nr:phosphoglucosamine mutase [Candidatus Saccharibacteria bacterium]
MEKRVFGATDGVRGKAGEWPLTEGAVRRLGGAVAKWFGENEESEQGVRILVGRDTRESGEWIAREICRGIREAGGEVVETGVLMTPALQKLIERDEEAVGGVMITASHNPAEENGLKVFKANGDKLSDEEELGVEEKFFELGEEDDKAGVRENGIGEKEDGVEGTESGENGDLEDGENGSDDEGDDAVGVYVSLVRDLLGQREVRGAKIVLDAAAGAGHDFSRRVFEDFGVEVEQIDAEPDGRNINSGCGALYPEKVAEKARELGCVGVALDGDADRIVLADEEGRVWSGDRIVVLLAEYLAKRNALRGGAVVLTEYSNLATIKYLEERGIRVEKVVNGDRFVVEKCHEIGAGLGGELSGHIIYLPWLESSDGTAMALFVLKIIGEENCQLADLWADYEDYPSKQWGIKVVEKREFGEIAGFTEAIERAREELGESGRVFIRYSGTENKMRILAEGEDLEMVEKIGESLAEIVKKEIGA